MDVRLTLVTLLTVPLLFAATTWFRKGARRGYDMVRTRIARINAFLQEHFAGAQTVQILTLRPSRWKSLTQLIATIARRIWTRSFITLSSFRS